MAGTAQQRLCPPCGSSVYTGLTVTFSPWRGFGSATSPLRLVTRLIDTLTFCKNAGRSIWPACRQNAAREHMGAAAERHPGEAVTVRCASSVKRIGSNLSGSGQISGM